MQASSEQKISFVNSIKKLIEDRNSIVFDAYDLYIADNDAVEFLDTL